MNIKVHESQKNESEAELNKMLTELRKLGFNQNPHYYNEPTFLALSFKLPIGYGKVVIEAGGTYLITDPRAYDEFGVRIMVNADSRDIEVSIADYTIKTSDPDWFSKGLSIVNEYVAEAKKLAGLSSNF